LDMLLMRSQVLRVGEDVVQVDKSRRSVKIMLMNRWKAAGAFIRPNGITSHS